MNISNIKLIKKLARLNVLETEVIKQNMYENKNDIIITDYDETKRRVIVDNVSNEELLLMVEAEKLDTLKSIKSMVKFFVGCAVTWVVIWLITFLFELGSQM